MIALSPFGKFPMMHDTFVQAGLQMLTPWGHIKPMMPMPGGGTTQGHVQELIETFGNDVIVASGGAIHGHPMGAAAGAKAFRQAFDVVLAGQNIEDSLDDNPELKVAIENWGMPGREVEGIFDLRS